MERKIKEFSGFSGSYIYLMEDDEKKFIRKINNIERNYNKLIQLNDLNYNVPKIYKKSNNTLDMQYIQGIDMRFFLKTHDLNLFTDSIIELINNFKKTEKIKNYKDCYIKKLEEIENYKIFPFTKKEFLLKLPEKLPQSICHGDLTFDNLIFSNSKFYMIDCITGDFDSWIFDIIKLRQDLKCKWFLRDSNDKSLYNCLELIENKLKKEYPQAFDDNLLILMLLRVYKYTKKDSIEEKFIIENIQSLWK
jgi:hypothetical protein